MKPKTIDALASEIPISALLKDLRKTTISLTRENAKFLVQTYYQLQRNRIVQNNRIKAIETRGQGHEHLDLLSGVFENLENEIKIWLDVYTENHPVGKWARDQIGVGPVIAAGFLAYLDMEKCPHISSFWSYAGYNPNMVWEKGQKRPFVAELKVVGWKLGESFVKVSSNPDAKYAQIYKQRKAYEWAKNQRGEYAHLVGQRGYKFGKDTEAFKWTSGQYDSVSFVDGKPIPASSFKKGLEDVGMLEKGGDYPGIIMIPPMAIQERAKRYAVKRFMSDLWVIAFKHTYPDREPPLPWINTHGGHPDYVPPVVKQS